MGSITTKESETVQLLRQRRAELLWHFAIEQGEKRARQMELHDLVETKQQERDEFQERCKEMKEAECYLLAHMDEKIALQKSEAMAATRRLICTEDLVRFYDQQRHAVEDHCEAECVSKGKRIQALTAELNEFNAEIHKVNNQRETPASISHLHHCLSERHSSLRAEAQHEQFPVLLASLQSELATVRNSEAEACAVWTCSLTPEARLERKLAGLRAEAEFLTELQKAEKEKSEEGNLLLPHTCIWRDEFDNLEQQLEKRAAFQEFVANANQAEQMAMSRCQSEAETELQEHELEMDTLLARCRQLRKSEACHARQLLQG